MNSTLEDLIRGSLAEHATAAPADPGLATTVAAAGRRVRRNRRTALAAIALVAAAGGAWGVASMPRPTTQAVATQPSASEAPHTPGTGLTRDVSGDPAAEFTSPDGNVYCRLDGDLAGCGLKSADPGVLPDPSTCAAQGAVKGVAVNASAPASWACGSDPMALPFLNGDGTRWWDASFGGTASWPNETRQLAALPAGKTLVYRDLRCTSTAAGTMACTNTETGHGFTASRIGVQLLSPTRSTTATAGATAVASPTSTRGVTVKNVTGMGAEVEGGRVSYFASPTGNIWCNLMDGAARCWARAYDPGAKLEGCTDGGATVTVNVGVQGPATWGCQNDIGGFPFLDSGASPGVPVPGKPGVEWWDATFGATAHIDTDSGTLLAVLPYDKTLANGDLSCTMRADGVACSNDKTGHGFVLSRSGAKLK